MLIFFFFFIAMQSGQSRDSLSCIG